MLNDLNFSLLLRDLKYGHTQVGSAVSKASEVWDHLSRIVLVLKKGTLSQQP